MSYRDPRIDQDIAVMVAIGARFARKRKGMGATERDIANELGTTEAWVIEFERGRAGGSWATTKRLAGILGFEAGDLEQIEMRVRREDNEQVAA